MLSHYAGRVPGPSSRGGFGSELQRGHRGGAARHRLQQCRVAARWVPVRHQDEDGGEDGEAAGQRVLAPEYHAMSRDLRHRVQAQSGTASKSALPSKKCWTFRGAVWL